MAVFKTYFKNARLRYFSYAWWATPFLDVKAPTATDASNSFQGILQVGYIEKAGDEQYCFFGQIAEIGLNPKQNRGQFASLTS